MSRSGSHRRATPPVTPSSDGPSDDFAARFTQVYPVLWTVAAAISGRPGLAEDIVHEAAVQAMGKLEQFRPGTSFQAWMSQIVRYVALNEVRAQRKHKAVPLEWAEDHQAMSSDARREVGRAYLTETGQLAQDQPYFDDTLLSALQTLEASARACLLLRAVQGLSYQEIAETLGIPEGTAMSHVHRSRQSLRQRLTPHTARRQENEEPQP